MKFLLTLGIIVFALLWWFGKGRPRPSNRAAPPAPPPPPAPQAMLACARCGVHLPRAEVFFDDQGRVFCGAEHRRLGPPR